MTQPKQRLTKGHNKLQCYLITWHNGAAVAQLAEKFNSALKAAEDIPSLKTNRKHLVQANGENICIFTQNTLRELREGEEFCKSHWRKLLMNGPLRVL